MSSSSSQLPEQGPRVATSSGSMPILEPLAPVLNENPTGFLRLPRELRDKVYTYLLSTEYNRHDLGESHFDTLRCHYTYRFHTSILYVNRQINHEASQSFYMDNLFIHINCGENTIANIYTHPWGSVLAKGAKAQQSARHAMEIELLSEGEVLSSQGKPHFIITYNELLTFCRSLLYMDESNHGSLASMKLRLIIDDEVGIDGDRAEEHEVTESRGVIESYPSGEGSSIEGSLARMENKIGTTSSRVRRLLEPFCQLHSIRDPQVIGPLCEKYKAEIVAQISKPLPSNQHFFDHVLTTSEKATNTFSSGDFALSISELRSTLDELMDARYLYRGDAYDEIITGPYAGYTIRGADKDIEFAVWTKLAWACLKTGDVNAADSWLMCIIRDHIDIKWEHENAPPGGHDIAMVFYLASQIWEEQDRVGYHDGKCRSYYLGDIIWVLKKGLRHEPGNGLLERELEKRELELVREMEIDDLMRMPDGLGIESELQTSLESSEADRYIPGWMWKLKG